LQTLFHTRSSTRAGQALVNVGCTALLLFLAWIDYVTGYEFGFFIFYFLPVSISAWYVGRRSGLAFAIFSATAWFLADRLNKHPYSHASFIYWETFMRLVSFVTTALTLDRIKGLVLSEHHLRLSLREAQDQIAHLRRGLDETTQELGNARHLPADETSRLD
jgi:hypothetical protein